MIIPNSIHCYTCGSLEEYNESVHSDGYVIQNDPDKIINCKKENHNYKRKTKKQEEAEVTQEVIQEKYIPKGKMGSYYVESVMVNETPKFLCKHESGELLIKDKIEFAGSIIRPLNEVGYIPYKFTSDEIQTLCESQLSTESILEEIKKIVDHFIIAKHEAKVLLQGDYLLSYCQEWISTVHYIFAVGETESGKSSILHLARWLCYRCLYGEDIPNADIYNFLGQEEEGCGTIAEDEAQDIYLNKEKMNMYKNSYAKGSLKSRIIGKDSKNKHQVHYKTFCPKWFAGEKIPTNKGFNERLAVIYMIEGEPKGNSKRLTVDEVDQLNQLRNRMLVWKLQHTGKGISIIKSGLKGRDQELWEDFLSLGHNTKYQEDFAKVVKYYIQQRHQSITNSIEAKLFKILYSLLDQNMEIKFLDFWDYLIEDNPEIPGNVNESKSVFYPDEYSDKISKQYLAKLFDNKFQGKKDTRVNKGTNKKQHQETFYKFKEETIQKLGKKYGLKQDTSTDNELGQLGQLGKNRGLLQ